MESRTPLGMLCLVFVSVISAFRLKHENAEGEADDRSSSNAALE
jgi:hypothetical protein